MVPAASAQSLWRALFEWRPHDAGLLGLRRAGRAALVMPVLLAAALLGTHDVQPTTFVGFGAFALVVLADFGGPASRRAVAYLVTALVGAVLIVAGTLAGQLTWLAVLSMLVVGFAVQFIGVFGGYAAASQSALLLAFVLAVSVPAPATATGARVEGWLVAGAAATVAALVLWPHRERRVLFERAAVACRALAALIETRREGGGEASVTRREEVARDAVSTARTAYAATPLRPAGPTRSDRALAELVVELDRGLKFASELASEPPGGDPPVGQEDALERALVETLRRAGDALSGGPPPDLAALDRAKIDQRDALERWALQTLGEGGRADDVLAGLRAGYRLRILSYVVLALGANATIVSGRGLPGDVMLPVSTPRLTGLRGASSRVLGTIRTELAPGSSVLHNSLRAAAGLALAVLLARVLGLNHAFWAVLGTLSVLRSNALATGRTTLQALAGTAVGFAIGAPFALLVGSHVTALWIALPVAVFLAAYTPTAVHFVVGQAAFTVLVIVLFNLIAPAGWTVGLVRVEDIALGTAVSVVVGLLLWPRGARADLSRALAQLYRSVAGYLAGSLGRLLDREAEMSMPRAVAVRARDRAGEALDQLMIERGARRVGFEAPAFLVAAGGYAILVGDLLDLLVAHGYRAAGCADEAAAIDRQARLMLGGFLLLADRLDGRLHAPAAGERVSTGVLHGAAAACLREWAARPSGPAAAGHTAMTLTNCAELVEQLADVTEDLDESVDAAARAARVAWWR
jgi:uncharacterized membrane protein YccC